VNYTGAIKNVGIYHASLLQELGSGTFDGAVN